MISAATSRDSLQGLARHLARPASSAVQASLLGVGRSALNTCTHYHTQPLLAACRMPPSFCFDCMRPEVLLGHHSIAEADVVLCLQVDITNRTA